MVKLLVTGGYFDEGGDGVVWLVDLVRERAEVHLRWSPPEQLLVPGKGFAGGALAEDGTLYVAAHAAVVRISAWDGCVTGVLHQPCMNDLHHVALVDDHLYVANTGLSAVDVFTRQAEFRGSHALVPAWANARRIGGDDPPGAGFTTPGWDGTSPASWPQVTRNDGYYNADRRSAPFHQLKVPDHLHVNHVAPVRDRLLATCFADGSLRDLRDFTVVTRFPGMYLHDGTELDGSFWLTAIDGTLLELDARTFAERRRLSVFDTGHHGWCRGLLVTPEYLVVGLTEVRADRLPRHRWADRAPQASETSVLLLDRQDGRLLARVDLTDSKRHSKLYSLLPLERGLA